MSSTRSLMALSCIGLLGLTACGSESGAQGEDSTFALQFASYNVPGAAESLAQEEWAERVEEKTGGRVTVEFFYQESLLGAAETLQGVGDGRAQMGWVAAGYYPAELPLTNVVSIPFVSEVPSAQGATLAQMYEENEEYRAEWNDLGVHVVAWHPSSENIVALKEPISSVDDLEGQKVRGFGYISQALNVAGVNPIALAQPEVYEALQRGILDGTSGASMNIATDRKFQEVAPYFTSMNFGSYSVTADVISLDVWNRMPADIQDALTSVSKEQPAFAAEFLAAEEQEACDTLKAAGGEAVVIPPQDSQSWREEAHATTRDAWAKDVAAVKPNLDTDKFYADYVDLLEKHEADSEEYQQPLVRCAGDGA